MVSRRKTILSMGALFLSRSARCAGFTSAPGDEANTEDNPMDDASVPQPGMWTLGGRQFWGDVVFRQGFRIQQHVYTRHYRLLDANDRRYESGTFEACEAALEKICQSSGLPLDNGHVVILLHGIGRSSKSLAPIGQALKGTDMIPVPLEYPSTRVALSDCAEYLATAIRSLTGAEKISFVVHSMGGLVVRRYLADHRDPRHHRMVMLGTPNHGAELADMLRNVFMFKTLCGPAGQELVTDAEGTIASLPVPDFPFGVVAGAKGDGRGYNHLLPDDNDGTVTVRSTRLEQAADFMTVPRLHSFLMSDPAVIEAVLRFLQTGRFRDDSSAKPPQP